MAIRYQRTQVLSATERARILMMATSKEMHTGTYNCRGHGLDKLSYISSIMMNCEILLQDHWYMESDILKIADFLENVLVYGTSGMDSKQLLHGRLYGECVILINKSLKSVFKRLDSACRRRCAGTLEVSGTKFLFVNVYLPCDTNHDTASPDLLVDVLKEVKAILDTNHAVNNVVFGEDFNTDLKPVPTNHVTTKHRAPCIKPAWNSATDEDKEVYKENNCLKHNDVISSKNSHWRVKISRMVARWREKI
ncbi:hypothetical protein CAPTEDRAFT_195087 [Capitella teleta]|uniref:Endonuclease/exonuclease/phosphatase domain-containing protein n=1 Tax=Capitella teleta TaxID=283909 RepID=R7U8V8_CAPTE|nr:hypothetical protein CAPTEDRAFT_195087 [Capitella teleta]|eukprot:ELU02561.1 hypothetical protein CAPTEDRAFT_195087 [Capitella teleta]